MYKGFEHHIDVIKTLAKDRGWSKQKVKSIRGQIISMNTFEERENYLKKIIASKMYKNKSPNKRKW